MSSAKIRRKLLKKYVVPLVEQYLTPPRPESFEAYLDDLMARCRDEGELREALGLEPKPMAEMPARLGAKEVVDDC